MRILIIFILGLFIFSIALPDVPAARLVSTATASPAVEDGNNIQSKAFRSGRGSFRSPRSGYTGGTRGGVTNGRGQRPGANTPVNRAPGPTNRFGGIFGGFLAGTLLGSLLNPFGFGGTGGFSFIGLIFWGVILYFVFRLLRRLFNRAR
ncbi:hypothetical protein [Cohnella silvisoli]|uniref:Uncharacterized protein n=1 Tax=Cohnella silvisoli TaxID=2873699 RepID=A0ABV1L133_9BACL|nr:hypothetical protein [Cohnella silvisoli]MCD9025335.1 hypothetical protein [Cohnella silvisoli]